MPPLKDTLKSIVARALRPAVWPLQQALERLESRQSAAADDMARLRARQAERDEETKARSDEMLVRLSALEDATERLSGWTLQREKHREELAFWRWLIATPGGAEALGQPVGAAFGSWQRERLRELGLALNLTGAGGALDPAFDGFVRLPERELAELDARVDAWCRECSVVEIGGGPFPAIASAPAWKRAAAVDPLARGYAEEGLLPPSCAHITYIEAPGERIPLPSGFAGLVIIENALDHVSDPAGVLTEIRRLLSPRGLLWVLVDLSEHRDPMHPHPFDEARIARMLRETGFSITAHRVSAHKSHPKAYGEYRALARREDLPPPASMAPPIAMRPA